MKNSTYKIITNKDLIAIDQDELGIQCKRIKTNGAEDILVKPLSNDEFAVCFLNKASTPSRMSQSIKEIIRTTFVTTPIADKYEICDLWCGKKLNVIDGFEADVPGHGVRIFKVKGV